MVHAQVLADQVRTLYRQTLVVMLANCVNTAIVGAFLWDADRRTLLSSWLGLTLLVSGGRCWLLWRYRRAAPDATDAPRWGWRFVGGSFASGLLWGGASTGLLRGADPSAQLVIIFFAGGMCTAAASGLASYLPAFIAFAGPTLLGLIGGIAAFGDPVHQVMSAVLALYGAGLFAVARVNHRALGDAFGLRFENAGLLTTLQRTQRDLEETNRTLEKRVAERSEAMRQQLEALRDTQRLEALGRLAGGIAHDFNNLLTVLLANISELTHDPKLDAGTKSGLREMREAASRGANLVHQLLTFSRRQPTSPQQLDLNLSVSRMQEWLGRLLGENLSLQVLLHPDPVFVHMDPTQMDQVIVNLITNARDAVAGGGRVCIQTQIEQLGEGLDGLAPGQYVVLSVTDTGIGMDAETRRRIFEPFFTTKELGKGTGLGLATAHGIVEQAGGKIRVSSEPGRGSCFRVYLPLRSAPDVAPPKVPIRSGLREIPRAARGVTILLVEDEPAIRAVTQRILSKVGYEVIAAESAEAALKLSAEHTGPLDLLVTDVVMAGMDGPSLAARLASLRPDLQTLFISGYSGAHDIPVEHPEGRVAFLPKPFTYDALITKVTALLAKRAPIPAQRDPAAGG